ncbi:Histone transcription regulator [Dirofilaria immitis]
MLSLTCMAIFCIILDIYAQKEFSQEQIEDSQPHMITSSKSETLRSDSLVNPQQFPIPLLGGFNPFQLKNQIVSTEEVSNGFEDWLRSLHTTSLFRPISLSNTGSLLGTVQTYPLTTNLTRLGNFGQLMGSSNSLSKSTNYEQKLRERIRNNGFEMNTPNSPIMAEKAGKEKVKGDDILSKNTFTTSSNINTGSQLYNSNGNNTDSTNNYYNPDLAMGKIPEAEENDEETTTTEDSLVNLKDMVTTLNLSQAQVAIFTKIIEKIVDEEIKKRRDDEKSESQFAEISEKVKLAGAKFHEFDDESRKNINDRYEEEIRPHEKLTANTRLSFDDQHINAIYRNGQDEISELLPGGSLKSDYRKEARKKADYMTREQAEYDRLVSGITDTTPEIDYSHDNNPTVTIKTITIDEPRNVPTINSPSPHSKTIMQPVGQLYIPSRTTVVYGKMTSFPRTIFERQADDFRNRLLGNNGFGDIIKALKHARIGFFERKS